MVRAAAIASGEINERCRYDNELHGCTHPDFTASVSGFMTDHGTASETATAAEAPMNQAILVRRRRGLGLRS